MATPEEELQAEIDALFAPIDDTAISDADLANEADALFQPAPQQEFGGFEPFDATQFEDDLEEINTDDLFEHQGGVFSNTVDTALEGTSDFVGGLVAGATREIGSQISPTALIEGRTSPIAEDIAEFTGDDESLSGQVGAGFGQAAARTGLIGGFAAGGAKIGSIVGPKGTIVGGLVGAAAGGIATMFQGTRVQLNEVEDRVREESDAEGEVLEAQVEEARTKALAPVLIGQGLDSTLSVLTAGGAGVVRKGVTAALTAGGKEGVKGGVRGGLRAGIKATGEAIEDAIIKRTQEEAIKALTRAGAIRGILTPSLKSAAGEAAGEFTEAVGTEAAIRSTLTDQTFAEAALEAAQEPEARRAALVGGIVGGGVRGTGELIGRDRRTRRAQMEEGLEIVAERIGGMRKQMAAEQDRLRAEREELFREAKIFERSAAVTQAMSHIEDPTNPDTSIFIPDTVATTEEIRDIINPELTGIDEFAAETAEQGTLLKLKEERLAEVQEQAKLIQKTDRLQENIKKQRRQVERILERAGEPIRRQGQPPGLEVFQDRGEREVLEVAITAEESANQMQRELEALREREELLGIPTTKAARAELVQEAEGLEQFIENSKEDAVEAAPILQNRLEEIKRRESALARLENIRRIRKEKAKGVTEPSDVFDRFTLDQQVSTIRDLESLGRKVLNESEVLNNLEAQRLQVPSGALATSLDFRIQESRSKIQNLRNEILAIERATGAGRLNTTQRAEILDRARRGFRTKVGEEALELDPDTDPRTEEEIALEIEVANSTVNVNNIKPKNALAAIKDKALALFNLDKDSPRQKIVMSRNLTEAQRAAVLKDMRLMQALLNKAVNDVVGITGIPLNPVKRQQRNQLLKDVGSYLKGDLLLENLPPQIQPQALQMRVVQDAMSTALIEEGAVEGDLAFVIEEGIGTYINRSYQKFSDPNWAKKIDPEVKHRVIGMLRRTPEFQRRKGETRKAWDERLASQLDFLINVDAQSPLHVIANEKIDRKLLSILKRRKDIPEEIRALWGEKQNALVMYSDSILKSSHLLAAHRHLTNIREMGLGDFLFDPNDTLRTPHKVGYNIPISTRNAPALEPLAGLRTSKEVYDELNKNFGPRRSIVPRWLFAINGFGKYGKTILSPITQVRNFVSNWFILARNGNLGPEGFSRIGTSLKVAYGEVVPTYLFNDDSESAIEQKNLHLKLIKLGVIDEAVTEGEYRDAARDAVGRDVIFERYTEQQTEGALSNVRNMTRSGLSLAEQTARGIYRGSDAFAKTLGWFSERKKYEEAFPHWSEEQLDAKAAEVVRATMPTYSLVPEIIKFNRQNPFVGPFVSFASETIRNEFNTIRLIKNEMSDASTRNIGIKRLMSWTAASVIPRLMLAEFGRQLTGTGQEEEEAVRTLAAPWDENASLVFMGKDKDGNARYYNISHTLPDSQIMDPITALNRNVSDFERYNLAAREFFDPFLGEEILAGAIVDSWRGVTKDGRELFSSEDTETEKWFKRIGHIANAVTPGALSSAHRFYLASAGEPKPSGVPVNFFDEMIANTTGQRLTTLDTQRALSFRAQDFRDGMQQLTQDFSSVVASNQSVTDEEIREAFDRLQQRRQARFDKLTKEYYAAIRLGQDPEDINSLLLDRNVGKANLIAVIERASVPYKMSDTLLDRLENLPGRLEQMSRALGDDFGIIFQPKKPKRRKNNAAKLVTSG